MPHEDVLRNGQMRIAGDMLIDRGDAGVLRVQRRPEIDAPAVEIHLALLRAVYAGDDLDKGRFSGAVLSHQRVNLACLELKADPIQRLDARKDLGDALQLEDILFHLAYPPTLNLRRPCLYALF